MEEVDIKKDSSVYRVCRVLGNFNIFDCTADVPFNVEQEELHVHARVNINVFCL